MTHSGIAAISISVYEINNTITQKKAAELAAQQAELEHQIAMKNLETINNDTFGTPGQNNGEPNNNGELQRE